MKKKLIWIEGIVVLALIAFVISYIEKPKEAARDTSCDFDILNTIVDDPEGKLASDKAVTQAVFDHYFAGYTKIPDCKKTALKSAKLVSVGKINHDVDNHFLADIVFDLEPLFPADTVWATPETSTSTAGWIKNKKGTLSIRKNDGKYYLVI